MAVPPGVTAAYTSWRPSGLVLADDAFSTTKVGFPEGNGICQMSGTSPRSGSLRKLVKRM